MAQLVWEGKCRRSKRLAPVRIEPPFPGRLWKPSLSEVDDGAPAAPVDQRLARMPERRGRA